MIVLDTSGLLAAIDASQRHHAAAAGALLAATPPLLVSPFVLAELDYLLATRVSIEADLALLGEVARGAYRLESMSGDDVAAARDLVDRYRDLGIGIADASLVVLASRYATRDVLSLDQGHLRAMRLPDGSSFRILPADAA